MQIYCGLYKNFEKIKTQFIDIVERVGVEMRCGMVGIQYLYDALTICGKADLAYDVIVNSNPGYRIWFENGATTLWEMWEGLHLGSHNHHMYSSVLAWFIKTLLGFNVSIKEPGRNIIYLKPCFIKQLDFCKGYVKTDCGNLYLSWDRTNDVITYKVDVPQGLSVFFNEDKLQEGGNILTIQE